MIHNIDQITVFRVFSFSQAQSWTVPRKPCTTCQPDGRLFWKRTAKKLWQDFQWKPPIKEEGKQANI